MTDANFVDIEVETTNAKALDSTVQQLGPAAVIEGSFNGTTCRVRCFGNCAGFIKFAITNQGYGKVRLDDMPDLSTGLAQVTRRWRCCGL